MSTRKSCLTAQQQRALQDWLLQSANIIRNGKLTLDDTCELYQRTRQLRVTPRNIQTATRAVPDLAELKFARRRPPQDRAPRRTLTDLTREIAELRGMVAWLYEALGVITP